MDNNIDFNEISQKVTKKLTSQINNDDSFSEIAKVIIDTSAKTTIEILKEYHNLTKTNKN